MVYILALDLGYDGINIIGVYTTYQNAVDAALLRSTCHTFNEYNIIEVDNIDDPADVKEYHVVYLKVKAGKVVVAV